VNRHLSARQISEWMIEQRTGERAAAMEAHLRECGECAAKLEGIEDSLLSFRGAVRDWSVSRMPVPVVLPRRRPNVFWMRLAATAAALAILAAVPLYVANQRHDAEIARQDDMLLRQVSVDVSRSVAEPMEPLNKLMFLPASESRQEKPE
jgi:hypothetical protein